MQSAQIGGPYFAGHMQNGTCGHKEQCLVDDVTKGVGNDTVDGKLRSYSDTANHKTDLVDEAVGQHAPHIICNHGVEYRKAGHKGPGPDQNGGPRKGSCQYIDGAFGRQGAHKHGAGDGSPGIGVRQPRMQRENDRIQTKPDKYQIGGRIIQSDIGEFSCSAFKHIKNDSGQQTKAAEKVPHKIP